MNRIFNNLEQFVSTLHLQVEMDYDEEEHIIYIQITSKEQHNQVDQVQHLLEVLEVLL